MVVLTQKGENKNQTKDIFRVTGVTKDRLP